MFIHELWLNETMREVFSMERHYCCARWRGYSAETIKRILVETNISRHCARSFC